MNTRSWIQFAVLIGLRPPALHHARDAPRTVRAVGSAPCPTSDLLRVQQREDEVREHQSGDDDADEVFTPHAAISSGSGVSKAGNVWESAASSEPMIRSHPTTKSAESAKNAIITAT